MYLFICFLCGGVDVLWFCMLKRGKLEKDSLIDSHSYILAIFNKCPHNNIDEVKKIKTGQSPSYVVMF